MRAPEPTTARERLELERERVVDRLRSLSVARLARPVDGRTPADAARSVAQQLADLAAAAESRAGREVPRLGDLAVGDQVAVTATDLLTSGADEVVLAAAADLLAGLRRGL